jgi:hypothetical protein
MKMPSVVFQTFSLWSTLESYETTAGGQSSKMDVFRVFSSPHPSAHPARHLSNG